MKLSKISILIIFMLLLAFSACEKRDMPDSSQFSHIDVKGVFLLDPSDDFDMSVEGLNPVQKYLFLIYDITSDSKNVELSVFQNSITVTLNESNKYEQLSSSNGKLLKSFLENCGYSVSTGYGTLWGGSDPVRMIAVFAINGNDITDNCSATFVFNLSSLDGYHTSFEITKEDIAVIPIFDGVFSVEEDPDAYQIAHSCKIRAEICKAMLEKGSQAEHNGDTNTRVLCLSICESLFSEDISWGVSCASAYGNLITSNELPSFKVESVRPYYPSIVDKIKSVATNIKTMNRELDKNQPNYDSVNSAQRSAHNTLIEILDFFE